MHGLRLEWKVCPDGAELHNPAQQWESSRESRIAIRTGMLWESKHRDRKPTDDDFEEWQALSEQAEGEVNTEDQKHGPPPAYFRNRSRALTLSDIEMVDLEDPVVLRFINAKNIPELESFFSRFGLLDYSGSVSYHAKLPNVLSLQDWLRDLIETASRGDLTDVVPAINEEISAGVLEGGVPLAFMAKFGLTLRPQLKLGRDGKRASLELQPLTLTGFMVMEVAMVALSGAKGVRCGHCAKLFMTGPRTHTRSDAKFCSERCRVAAMRARKAKEVSEGEEFNG